MISPCAFASDFKSETKPNSNAVLQQKSNEVSSEDESEVSIACVLFAMVGVGYLFPFSALTQPVDYWQLLFPDFNIEFLITSVFMYTNLVMLALLVFYGSKPWFTGRIVGGFVGQFIVLIFVPTSYFFLTTESANKVAVLGATAFVAIVTAFLDSSAIALASYYPTRVLEALQFGIGLSTLIGSIYRDITKLIFPADEVVASTFVYFYTGAFTIGLCIVSYFWLLRLPLSKRCLASLDQPSNITENTSLLELLDGTSYQISHQSVNEEESSMVTRIGTLRKCLFNQCMVTLIFTSTLALWPPLITEMKSFNFPSLQASGWWPLILLTFFSFSDCFGRLLVPYRGILSKDNIYIFVLLRFGLFPLIICSVKGVIFTHDLFSVVFVILLGGTNGYLGSLSIVFVNECVSESEKSIAGMFTGFFLNTGLVLGASAGLIMEKLVVQS